MIVNFARSTRIIFTTHLLRMLRSRRMLLMAVFATLPAGAGLLASALAPPHVIPDAQAEISWFLLLMLVMPFLCLISGSAVVSEELADRTLTYVFSRPVSRVGFFAGRLLASLLCVSVLVCLATWGLFMWTPFKPPENPGDLRMVHAAATGMRDAVLPVALLGAVVYTTLFAAIGAIVKRAMIVGIGYSMVVEGLVANLPGNSASLSIQHHMRSLLVTSGGDQWERVGKTVHALFESRADAFENLVITLVLFLVLGALVIRRKQYLVTV